MVVNYSPKKKKTLPLLLGVPMFQGIRIHSGNTSNDTEGCILVGENRAKGMVLESRYWMAQLMLRIAAARARGEKIWITVE